MKVLFRSDSSSSIGHGHIKRDLILARQYEDVSFACMDLKGSLIDEIPYPVFELSSASIYELINLIKKHDFKLLIIDHYDIDKDDELLIKLETGIKILVLDDMYKEHYCDVLLNVNAYAKPSDYTDLVPKFCELKCGFSYALLRDEFYEEARIKREKKYDFFICMGGVDVKNLSASLANEISREKSIVIATTSANANLKELKNFVESKKNISLVVDSKNLALLMNESKKLIIQASSLINEALMLKAKFTAICTAKNQEHIATWLGQKGYEVRIML